MRQTSVRTVLALLVFGTGCLSDAAGPNGPVTVRFVTPSFPGPGGTTIYARGPLIFDAQDTITVPEDSLVGVARGAHQLSAFLDIAYVPTTLYGIISPNGSSLTVPVPLPLSCRLYEYDGPYCGLRSVVRWRGHPRTYCPVNDFGDFCSYYPDGYQLGMSWPADTVDNQYLSQAKLLVGAVLGPDAPAARAGDTLAMALFRGGDYSTRHYLAPVGADSSRWQSEVWTDMRRVPLSGRTPPALNADDRVGDNFGLAVRTTFYQPATFPNALFVRFDVRNVSAEPDFRRAHPEEPVGGHTLHDVYLTPVLDPAIACGLPNGCSIGEDRDDNATAFAADSLLVAYDEEFSVPEFTGGYATAPGLLGLRLIDGPAGTSAKAVLFDGGLTPDFLTPTLEHSAYRLLSGGRAGSITGCADDAPAALVCAPETRSDIRMGWSVGPVATLAPGDSTHLVVALLFAPPEPGTFTSGTAIAPGNTSAQSLADTTRAIYAVAARLRALSGTVKGIAVDGSPAP
jgi:hypothetical protein